MLQMSHPDFRTKKIIAGIVVALGLILIAVAIQRHGTCYAFEGSSKKWLKTHAELSRQVCEPYEKLVSNLPGGEGSIPSAELVHY
jgi:hypothetical protein